MNPPTSLTAFVSSLKAYQDVWGGMVQDRIAALEDRLKFLNDQRGDDHDALVLRAQDYRKKVSDGLAALVDMVKAQAKVRSDRINADEERERRSIETRFDQDREAIEQQIQMLESVRMEIVDGVGEQTQQQDHAAGLGAALEPDGSPVDVGIADGTYDLPGGVTLTISSGHDPLEPIPPGTVAIPIDINAEHKAQMSQAHEKTRRLAELRRKRDEAVTAAAKDPKAGPPVWRGQKPITDLTDGEIEDIINSKPGNAERQEPLIEPIPPDIYFSVDNFYDVETHHGMGNLFYAAWSGRASEFPSAPGMTVTVTPAPEPPADAPRLVPRFKDDGPRFQEEHIEEPDHGPGVKED